jgi:acetylornithine deacetylase
MNGIQVNNGALVTLLQEMVWISSVNPSLSKRGTGEGRIARYIGECLEGMGLDTRYQEIEKDRVNVIGIMKGTGGGRRLMLNGHMDTVSVENMDIDPFMPEMKDGKLYGRGSLDMKGGIAAQIMAVRSIIESGRTLKGDVVLTFVADEEYASIGTEAVLKDYSSDAAIICEPTNPDIIIAHKGFAWIRIEVFGRAAHGSLPETGIDAISKAGKALTAI